MEPLHTNGQKLVNQTPLKALVKALVMREGVSPPRDVFCFEVAVRALHDGVSLEEISHTARFQLTTCIVQETVLCADGNKVLAARLLQVDEVALEGWISPIPHPLFP